MSEHGAPAEGVLTVFAAASLSDAFEAVGRRFEAAHPGERVTFNFAGSQQLAQQLAQGAPGDVFASADERQMAAVVLAQTFVASPFYLRSAILGFGAVEPELAQSAALDGAGEWAVFRHVILPLSRGALLSGAMMTWARELGEFGATIIFAGNFPGRTQTMPLAIYLGFELELDVALTLSVILLALSFLVLIGVRGLLGRERE